MSELTEPLGAGLSYEDTLPLRWTVVSAPADASYPRLEEANAEFLRTMSALEEHALETADENPELAHEIQRLESKVNLLLGMVSRLLTQQQPLPAPLPVRLNAGGIEWVSPLAPAVGDHVQIELYLRQDYPLPLLLAGRVGAVASVPAGRRTEVVFEALGDTVQDWLEKTIFRYHRRLVAHSRRGGV